MAYNSSTQLNQLFSIKNTCDAYLKKNMFTFRVDKPPS